MMFTMLLTGILAAFVNFLLLLGTNRLLGSPSPILRALLAAMFAGIYSALCIVDGFAFLGRVFFRVLMLLGLSVIAYGCKKHQLQKGSIFALLHMALSWLSLGAGGGAWTPLFAATGILFLCSWSTPAQTQRFIPVELTYDDVTLKILALKDTGNCLKDPVTGRSVLVISPKVAEKLTGLTQGQLKDPVGTMGAIPGLRLIPFSTVGNKNGLMLAMRFKNVKIGAWQGSALVAFAPEGLENMDYQGITGGAA